MEILRAFLLNIPLPPVRKIIIFLIFMKFSFYRSQWREKSERPQILLFEGFHTFTHNGTLRM